MKIRYVFIIFIVIMMVYAFYKVKIQKKDLENEDNSMTQSNSQEIKKSKEITLAIPELDTINPIITTNKKVQDIDRLIFEPLINITENYKTEYCLAKECAKTTNNTYILKLREAVKWSDGSKFTSDDVKFTIDKLKENNNSVYSLNVNNIKEVDIIDNYTLKIILEKEVRFFEYYLNFPILSSSYYANEDFWNTEKNKMPVTTGRYKISEVTNNTITLEKNKSWWSENKNGIIEQININLYSTVAEMYNAFKMGRIDLISTQNDNYESFVGTIGYDTSEINGRNFIFLAINTNSNFLSDTSIRKAIRDSIDKNRVISNSYGKMFKETNFIMSQNHYLVEQNNENFYNIDEKNNLLQESGWILKNGVWQKMINNKWTILELNLVVRTSDSIRCKAAEDIKNQMQEQGIVINIVYADDNLYNSYLNNINYDMMLCSIEQPIAPDLNTYFGYNNLANFNNQEIKDIISNIGNITDENELKSKYQRLYEIYNEEVPYIGLARNKILTVKNTNLVGEIKANWYNLFYNIDEWYKIDG